MSSLARLGLLWRTLRPLRARQIWTRIFYRLRPARVPQGGAAPARRVWPGAWVPGIDTRPSLTPPDRFSFIGHTATVTQRADWDRSDMPRLWRYNLHYFDDLRRADAQDHRVAHSALMARWVADNPPLVAPGWEPYPMSLRIVNWVRWAQGGGALPAQAADSLAQQLRVLSARPEYHLLGNHLLANAKALAFGGAFFEGAEAEAWWAQGIALWCDQVAEQFLPDGGHFERAPMYHAILLEDLLDMINLGRAIGRPLPETQSARATAALAWLAALSHGDGGPAYFNDTACGIAPPLAALAHYAQRLGLQGPAAPEPGLLDMPQSGYVRLQAGDGRLVLFDAAPVGAPYLLGHGHADTLSLELSWGAERIVVNSGTSTYEPGRQRLFERSTAAHSTLQVGAGDSSEVWDAFRCGRAARIKDRRVGEGPAPQVLWAEAAHDGYAPHVHHRRVALEPTHITITDRLTGGPAEVTLRFILAPEVTAEAVVAQRGHFVLRLPSGRAVLFEGAEALSWQLSSGFYAQTFGIRTQTLVLEGRGRPAEGIDLHSCFSSKPTPIRAAEIRPGAV